MLTQIGGATAELLDLAPVAPGESVSVRPARISDMLQVEPLINHFAAQNLMLPKTREQLVRLFREFVVAVDGSGRLLGCGGLRIFSPELAEVISLAVSPAAQGLGVGGRIVDRLVEDAETLGLNTVFALTLRDGFFHRLGFRTVPKEMFPAKVWSDCRNCPKLHACDEIAVVREVR
ncbi:MAG TPA: N-acetyltransferase [Longimicrobium sp.]|jgi:amino-acid N-acetyltransferase|uniref:N-acetyltransferase n=1 Tax=Longimicrobium sp. TaxID=2029185 RepID=UPI002EDAD84A